jgi:hypothetical protein
MSAVWKHIYWLDEARMSALLAQKRAEGIDLPRAQQNACEILLSDIGYAAPDIWQVICRHDAGPWYEQSPYAGKYVVASSRPLARQYEPCLSATIEPVEFTPPAMPDAEQTRRLAESPSFAARVPQRWWAFPRDMGDAIVSGLRTMFGSNVENFDELHRSWSAYHANFLDPQYRSGVEFGHAAYGIAESAHISSCCVELFNMLGSKEPQLVRPCIGSVIVKALQKDCYYLMKPVRRD